MQGKGKISWSLKKEYVAEDLQINKNVFIIP